MDPEATLAALREAVDVLEGRTYAFDPLGDNDDVRDVVRRFRDLDEWLSKGGWSPWARKD